MSSEAATRRRRLAAAALLAAAGFALTFLVALHTGAGLRLDARLYARVSGSSVPALQHAGRTALETIDASTLALGVLVLAFLGLARGRPAQAAAAAGVVVCSIGSTELLKHVVLPRIAGAVPAGRPPSFPSGHTSIAVSLGLGLVLAAPAVLRPLAALVGASYASGIALSLVMLGAHYPSDVVASFLLCTFWTALAGLLLGAGRERDRLSRLGLTVALVSVVAALAAGGVLAERHPVAVTAVRSSRLVVAAGLAFGALSLVSFGAVTFLVGDGSPRQVSRSRRPESAG